MPVKVKLGGGKRSFLWKLVRFVLVLLLIVGAIGAGVYAYYSHEYRGLVDERLANGPLFASIAQVYAAPQEVRPGQRLTAASLAASLRHAGYNSKAQLGSFELRGDAILIKPGPQSYLATDGATINTTGDQVQSITAEKRRAARDL